MSCSTDVRFHRGTLPGGGGWGGVEGGGGLNAPVEHPCFSPHCGKVAASSTVRRFRPKFSKQCIKVSSVRTLTLCSVWLPEQQHGGERCSLILKFLQWLIAKDLRILRYFEAYLLVTSRILFHGPTLTAASNARLALLPKTKPPHEGDACQGCLNDCKIRFLNPLRCH